MSVIDWLKSQKIKYRLTGDEAEVGCMFDTCPNYGEFQMYINTKTERWCCKRCDNAGINLKQLQFKLGLVSLREPVKAQLYIPEMEVQKMQSDLLNNAEAMEYLTTKRMLRPSTIRQFKLGLMQDKFGDYSGDCIVFPDFYKGSCVSLEQHFFKKENGANKKIKSGSRSQLYNSSKIDLTQPVFITEGRYDTLSGWQYGYKNIGSVPNGADSSDGDWVDEIKAAPRFYIASDADSAGFVCAEKLSKRLGRSKCYRIHLELKDLNEYLVYGVPQTDLKRTVDAAESMFAAPITEIGAYTDLAKEVLLHPNDSQGIATEWPLLNNIIKGIRPGELTTVCGRSGQGKTTFTLALTGHMIRQNAKCLIISPEVPEQDILIDLASNYLRKRVTTPDELDRFTTQFKDRVYIANVFDTWTDKKNESLLDKVFDIIQYSIDSKGVQFVVLDHLRLFLNSKQQDGERFEIDAFLRQCVHTVIGNSAHIVLVAQPRKNVEGRHEMCKSCQKPLWKKIGIDDLKGSSNIEQDSNNIILVHRYLKKFCACKYKMDETCVEVEVAKNRKFGVCDTVLFKFDTKSKACYMEAKI